MPYGLSTMPIIMGYSVVINGIRINCDSVHDLRELIAATEPGSFSMLGAQFKGQRTSQSSVNSTDSGSKLDKPPTETQVLTCGFLSTIQEAGEGGITTDQLVERVSLKGSSAVGGVVITVDRVLKDCQIERDEAYVRRGKNGSRRWFAGPRIREAIQTLQPKEKESEVKA